MMQYKDISREGLLAERELLSSQIADYENRHYNLVMARGKPCEEQLLLSLPLLDVLRSDSNLFTEDGLNCKNYGGPLGILEARKLFGEYMGVEPDEVIVGGSSSLIFMSNVLACSVLRGVLGSGKPWRDYSRIKFICPVPGYDRHYRMCNYFGIEMISVPLNEDGPDMDLVEQVVSEDDAVKGIWCVPKYSNPTGTSYSDEVVRRLSRMKTAAKDFRIFWDNAYAVHYVYKRVDLLNILDECKKAGNPNRVYIFGSTSKITFPGAGVCFFGASRDNIVFMAKEFDEQGAGWDKLNMLRHVRYLKSIDNINRIMDKHAEILRIRFDVVINALDKEIIPRGAGSYIKPCGGYFITYKGLDRTAKKIVSLCKKLGVELTPAGATHPFGNDPEDAYIRLAPSSVSVADLEKAMEIFCVVARYAAVEKLLTE